MKYEAIEKRVKRIKKHISGLMEQKRWEEALSEIALAAHILYDANLYYVDEELEGDLFHIAKEVVEPAYGAEEAAKGDYEKFSVNVLSRKISAMIFLTPGRFACDSKVPETKTAVKKFFLDSSLNTYSVFDLIRALALMIVLFEMPVSRTTSDIG